MTNQTNKPRTDEVHRVFRSPLFWLALMAIGLACGILDPWVLIRLGN